MILGGQISRGEEDAASRVSTHCQGERIYIQLMSSDRQLKASVNEGSTGLPTALEQSPMLRRACLPTAIPTRIVRARNLLSLSLFLSRSLSLCTFAPSSFLISNLAVGGRVCPPTAKGEILR